MSDYKYPGNVPTKFAQRLIWVAAFILLVVSVLVVRNAINAPCASAHPCGQ